MRNIGASIGTTAESTLVEHITPYRRVVRDYALELNLATLSGHAVFGMILTVMIARFRSTIGRSLARVQPS